jgi:hypothetical protein
MRLLLFWMKVLSPVQDSKSAVFKKVYRIQKEIVFIMNRGN